MPRFPTLNDARKRVEESKEEIPLQVILVYGELRNGLSSKSLKWLWDDFVRAGE